MIENGTSITVRLKPVSTGTFKPIAGEVSHDCNVSRALRETTVKASAGWKQNEYGLGEADISVEAKFDADALTANFFTFNDLVDALINKTKLSVEVSDGVTGHRKVAGTVLVESVPLSAPMEDNATYTVSLKFDGAPTISTI